MTEPICPSCDGNGTIEVYLGPGEIELSEFYFVRHENCPVCYGAGIATLDEVKEFINYIKEK